MAIILQQVENTTSLRLQKESIVRYGVNSEVLDFSGNDFIFSD
jgi:hypothetical protein